MKTPFAVDQYGKPERLVTPSEIESYLDELEELSTTAGILLEFDTVREKIERTDRFRAEFAEARETRRATVKRLAGLLVDGEIDLKEAAMEATLAEATGGSTIISASISLSEEIAAQRALADFASSLPDDLLDRAQARAAEVREQIIGLRDELDGIRDAEAATAAGSKTATAWASYRSELLPAFDATHELIKRLRAHHLLAPLPLAARDFSKYGRMDRARDARQEVQQARGEAIRPILDPICDDWIPTGPHSEKQALAFLKEVETEEQEAKLRAKVKRLVPDRQTVTSSTPSATA